VATRGPFQEIMIDLLRDSPADTLELAECAWVAAGMATHHEESRSPPVEASSMDFEEKPSAARLTSEENAGEG